MKKESIKQLTDREHILQRSSLYIGSTSYIESQEFVYNNNKFEYKQVKYVPGFIKIINEIIDNSIDEALKTDFKYSNKIKIKIDKEKNIIKIEDNGRGIPTNKNKNNIPLPRLCWGYSRAGSNFDDDENRKSIGTNGLGSYATNIYSTSFKGITCDGNKKYIVKFKDNAKTYVESYSKGNKNGTTVEFSPDLSRFELEKIDDNHINIIEQRLIHLSASFPIDFYLNNKKIKANTSKTYLKYFNDIFELIENDNYLIGIMPNDSDIFRFSSYVNGLNIYNGGKHIDIISNNIVNKLKQKIGKKYPNIKPGDIKNKLQIITIFKNFPNPKFSSQTKTTITNTSTHINNYLGNIDYDKIVNKITKSKEFMEPITELYKLKQELQKRKELKNISKIKKIKSDKFYPSTESSDYLLIAEGYSAFGGISPALGRKNISYFTLKGKPLNVFDLDLNKILQNEEMKILYQVLRKYLFKKIIIATDADLDGYNILQLMLGFFSKVYNKDIYFFKTPVITVKQGTKIIDYEFEFKNIDKIIKKYDNKKFQIKYSKGLGSNNKDDMKYIIKKEGGIESLIEKVNIDDVFLDDFLSKVKSDKRKEYIIKNNFELIKL